MTRPAQHPFGVAPDSLAAGLVEAIAFEEAAAAAAVITGGDRMEIETRARRIASTIGVTPLAAVRIIVETGSR